MNKEALVERLNGIEWDDFEVKAATMEIPEDAYRTVSAFSNSSGGWLVFGVREEAASFHVDGVVDPDAIQGAFLSACRAPEKFSRPVDVRAYHHVINGASVLAFSVPPAPRYDRPIRVRIKKHWESYVRLGSGDHRCSIEEESRFMRDASLNAFDSIPLEEASVEDLDPASIRWLRGVIS